MYGVDIPPKGTLSTTGPVDPTGWYHRPLLGRLMRSRLSWVREQLPDRRLARVLEVGYGSGVFQPELARRAIRSVGIDVHHFAADVRRRLNLIGIHAFLVRADGAALPFSTACFDAVIAVSTLEFVANAKQCVRECARVLRPGGSFYCVTPRRLRWADLLLRYLVGVDPEADFRGGRERTRRALLEVLPTARWHRRPRWLPQRLAPYDLVVYRRPGVRSRGER